MKDIINKAETLVEALPYIREFYNQSVVIKYGGSAMEDEKLKEMVLTDIAIMKYVGIKPVIIHGGGKHITHLANRLGKESTFVDGYRVTDDEMMEITEMVLAGRLNKSIVSHLNLHGVKAVGISGRDAGCITARSKGEKYGFVGEIEKVDAKLIRDLEENDYVPVISPIASDQNGQALNVNADIAASEIARAIKAKKLVLLTDVNGIYKDINDKNSLYSSLTVSQSKKLIDEGIIVSGMLPKIRACIDAIQDGVGKIHIINGKISHSLLLEIFTKEGVGTQITSD